MKKNKTHTPEAEPVAVSTDHYHPEMVGGYLHLKAVHYSDGSRRFFYKNQLRNDDFLELTAENAAILCTVGGRDLQEKIERFTDLFKEKK